MKVNISAAAAPGAKIKFLWERGSWSKWGVIQAASESAACTWAPPSSGSYTLYADVTVGGLTSTSRLPVRISEDYSVDGLSLIHILNQQDIHIPQTNLFQREHLLFAIFVH